MATHCRSADRKRAWIEAAMASGDSSQSLHVASSYRGLAALKGLG